MAYIIGEPIINIIPAKGRECRISVRFPVRETHTEQVHYRGITIALDPERLWLLEKDSDAPAVFPDYTALPLGKDQDGTYAENLLKVAEIQEEVAKMAQDEGVDLQAAAKVHDWLQDATRRAAYLLFGSK